MSNLEQAARQALEALETLDSGDSYKTHNAAAGLREALAEQAVEPEQEPVYAFRRKGQDSFCTCDKERYEELVDKPNLFEVTTFYATPVRTVDLTDDEIREAYSYGYMNGTTSSIVSGLRAVIAKFKEKNQWNS